MKNYNIYIRSNEHPRTINSFTNSRCYFTKITVKGKDALKTKVAELKAKGEHISEICTDLGARIRV